MPAKLSIWSISDGQGGSLTLNDILADLTADSHGNAVVNLGHGDSIVFEHITAAVIQSQINQGQPGFHARREPGLTPRRKSA